MTARTGPDRPARRVMGARLPLRWRVAVAFAVCALVVTGLVAMATWQLASNYMLDQRFDSAQRQFAANSRLATTFLQRHQPADGAQALLELEYDQEDFVALRVGGRWSTDGPPIDPRELEGLAAQLSTAPHPGPDPNTQRRTIDNRPVLATAVAIPEQGAVYMELATLDDLNKSLKFIGTVLVAGVGVSLVLGLLLGRWAGWRAMRPLTQLTDTAARVASGDLSARLPVGADTDLAPLATTFNRTAAALEERVARDARFAADVSHELRSPLTTMINASAVLNRRRTEFSDTSQHALRLLTADLERFQRMVSDLLEISRNQPEEPGELEACDLVTLVRHALEIRHEAVTLDAPTERVTVSVDRRRLDRIVANLLENATTHGGGAVRVAVCAGTEHARLEIDDAGPGVPAELRDQIFERFARGARAGDRGVSRGSGLGLALVVQHVRHHRGRVWVEDRPTGGARFVVELPLAE